MRRVALIGMAALVSLLGSSPSGHARGSGSQAPSDAEKDRKKLERLAKPWPNPRDLAKRQAKAENLPLFRTAEPLEITLTADFRAVNRDRTVDSPKTFPALLRVTGDDGQPVEMDVRLSTRGNLRLDRKICTFPPLRVELSKKQARGTPFARQGSLKLVTHCRNGGHYEQQVVEEALIYRIANLMTPASYRTRLVRATYVDSRKGKKLATKWAFFIEDGDDVARRLQGRIAPLEKKLFRDLDRPALLRLAVFQFAIGNTDYSIHALHNLRLVQDRHGALRPLAYDFDATGLVDPPYGAPSRKLPILSLRDRYYRGPCLPLEDLEPTLAEFRAREPEILGLYDAEPALDDKRRQAAKEYLADFFDIIDSPKRSKSFFVDRCRPADGM